MSLGPSGTRVGPAATTSAGLPAADEQGSTTWASGASTWGWLAGGAGWTAPAHAQDAPCAALAGRRGRSDRWLLTAARGPPLTWVAGRAGWSPR